MGARRRAAHLIALALAFVARGGAQEPATGADVELVVILAAAGEVDGPPAWAWMRRNTLQRVVEVDCAPDEAIELRLDSRGRLTCRPAAIDVRPAYAVLELRGGGEVLARGQCEVDGSESWTVPARLTKERLPAALCGLVDRFAYEARTGWLALDLATASGNLMVAAATGDPLGDALTACAAECGTLVVVARRTPDGALQVQARSGGGLALPAVLLALADAQSGIAPARHERLADDLERWLVLAASAQSAEQEEAARQLSRFDDLRARAALERMLHAGGRARVIAMEGLVRLGAVDSLGAIVAAADPGIEGSVELAAVAVWSLSPQPVRDALAAREPAVTRPVAEVREVVAAPDPDEGRRRAWWITVGTTVLCLALTAFVALRRAPGTPVVSPGTPPA